VDQSTFANYAHFYDALYKEKDYGAETSFVLSIFLEYLGTNPKTLLDIGCGTGGHLLHFAEAGLDVTGIDVSKTMIALAEEKIGKARGEQAAIEANPPKVRVGDARFFEDGKAYDACVSMFAVMGYLNSNEDLAQAFGNIRRSLRKGGLFIFDVWFGPAVLAVKPETRIKDFQNGSSRVLRIAVPRLDHIGNIVTVEYTILQLKADQLVSEVHEHHKMRFFFVPELQLFLQNAGLMMIKVCPFMDSRREPTIEDWNITVVSRAI
jgi:SAM-dependent methyltransferase